MPRKKNRRKEIQKAKRVTQPKPKKVATIGRVSAGHSGLAIAAALAFADPAMVERVKDREDK